MLFKLCTNEKKVREQKGKMLQIYNKTKSLSPKYQQKQAKRKGTKINRTKEARLRKKKENIIKQNKQKTQEIRRTLFKKKHKRHENGTRQKKNTQKQNKTSFLSLEKNRAQG